MHAELGVDVADVGVHGGVRHAEALRDGGRVEVVHQQGEHLGFAGREPVRDDEAAQAFALLLVEVAQACGLAGGHADDLRPCRGQAHDGHDEHEKADGHGDFGLVERGPYKPPHDDVSERRACAGHGTDDAEGARVLGLRVSRRAHVDDPAHEVGKQEALEGQAYAQVIEVAGVVFGQELKQDGQGAQRHAYAADEVVADGALPRLKRRCAQGKRDEYRQALEHDNECGQLLGQVVVLPGVVEGPSAHEEEAQGDGAVAPGVLLFDGHERQAFLAWTRQVGIRHAVICHVAQHQGDHWHETDEQACGDTRHEGGAYDDDCRHHEGARARHHRASGGEALEKARRLQYGTGRRDGRQRGADASYEHDEPGVEYQRHAGALDLAAQLDAVGDGAGKRERVRCCHERRPDEQHAAYHAHGGMHCAVTQRRLCVRVGSEGGVGEICQRTCCKKGHGGAIGPEERRPHAHAKGGQEKRRVRPRQGDADGKRE